MIIANLHEVPQVTHCKTTYPERVLNYAEEWVDISGGLEVGFFYR